MRATRDRPTGLELADPPRERLAVADAELRDSGLPPDPGSPFAEERARSSRRSAEPPPTGRIRLAAIRSWLIVLAMIAAATYAGLRITEERLAAKPHVPSQAVQRGTPLVRLRVFDSGAARVPASRGTTTVTSPIDGVTTAVLAREGGALERGSPVVELFDPRSAWFELAVEPDELAGLARGMDVTLTSTVASGSIGATISDIRPPAAATTSAAGHETPLPTLVLEPTDTAQLRSLVPGLQFEATVDTESVPEDAREIVRIERR
jgi:multidrug efflux pump subunit AcrA (membrane-fusion protein)